jgi:DNA-binding response OmpR family regulator
MQILVIDDDDSVRESILLVLSASGFSVVGARNGWEGTRLLQGNPATLVITDILMPEKEGIEIIREIRAQAPETPIIAISGAGGGAADYLRMARAFGANAVLAKPFEPADLLTLVQKLTGAPSLQSF